MSSAFLPHSLHEQQNLDPGICQTIVLIGAPPKTGAYQPSGVGCAGRRKQKSLVHHVPIFKVLVARSVI